MRKLIYAINTTLDGCVDHTKGIGGKDVHQYFANMLRQAGTLLYGRVTYELMVPFWPDIANNKQPENEDLQEFAQAFDAVPEIVVFSRTMDKKQDGKTTVLSGNLKEEVLKLKQQPGKDIALGGVDLPSQLMELGLIDEYRFVVQPVLAGEGRRFPDGIAMPDMLQLKLIDTKVFPSGCVALHYVKDNVA